MQIFNWLIQALKMELGFVKIKDVGLNLPTPNVGGEVLTGIVVDLTERISGKLISLSVISTEPTVRNVQTPSSDLQIDSTELKFSETNVCNMSFASDAVSCLLFNDEKFSKILLNNVSMINDSVETYSLDAFCASVLNKTLPVLRIAKFSSKPIPKSEKLVKAIIKMRAEQEISSDFIYVGFYTLVPLRSAKRVVVIGNELILELSDKSTERKDVIVFKKDQEYKFLVFSVKQLMQNM